MCGNICRIWVAEGRCEFILASKLEACTIRRNAFIYIWTLSFFFLHPWLFLLLNSFFFFFFPFYDHLRRSIQHPPHHSHSQTAWKIYQMFVMLINLEQKNKANKKKREYLQQDVEFSSPLSHLIFLSIISSFYPTQNK